PPGVRPQGAVPAQRARHRHAARAAAGARLQLPRRGGRHHRRRRTRDGVERPDRVSRADARLLPDHRLHGRGAMTRQERIATAVALALGVSLLAALPARAQEVNLAKLDDGPVNRVYVRTGAEWAFTAAIGYARSVSVARHPALLVGELTAPWAS